MRLDAVQSEEDVASEALERPEGASLPEDVEAEREEFAESLGRGAIEQFADPVVFGNMPHAKQSLAAVARLAVLQPALPV